MSFTEKLLNVLLILRIMHPSLVNTSRFDPGIHLRVRETLSRCRVSVVIFVVVPDPINVVRIDLVAALGREIEVVVRTDQEVAAAGVRGIGVVNSVVV